MKIARHIPILLVLVGTLFTTVEVLASATADIAGIMMRVNHYPSDADRAILRRIVDDPSASKGIQVIASALLNMNHSVSDADRKRLRALQGDASATSAEKELAGILAGINHKASAEDRAKLKTIP